jgi:DNA replication protein DnaC
VTMSGIVERNVNCIFHGTFLASFYSDNEHSQCPNCREWKRLDDETAERELQWTEHIERLKKAAGVPGLFHSASFENFDPPSHSQRHALKAVRKFAEGLIDGSSANLVLMGGVGLGKTHLLASLVWKVLDAGIPARFCRVSEVLGTCKASWKSQDSPTELDILAELKKPSLLILDDVGLGQTGSESDRRIIESIVDGRWSASKPTAISTNAESVNALETYVGPRVVSRLLDKTLGSGIVLVSGSDYRTSGKPPNRPTKALFSPERLSHAERMEISKRREEALRRRRDELWKERIAALDSAATDDTTTPMSSGNSIQ